MSKLPSDYELSALATATRKTQTAYLALDRLTRDVDKLPQEMREQAIRMKLDNALSAAHFLLKAIQALESARNAP